MKIDTVAALKRLPIGTKLLVVRSLLGANRPTERTLRQVRSKDLVFEITDAAHRNHGQNSYLDLSGVRVEATENGFRILEKDSGDVCVEYLFAEPDRAAATEQAS